MVANAKLLFSLGQTVASPACLAKLQESNQSPNEFFFRHQRGDWGLVDEHDRHANEDALKNGARLMSVYRLEIGIKIWCITEADRASTCLLLPDEY
jgi:hypothetical protein